MRPTLRRIKIVFIALPLLSLFLISCTLSEESRTTTSRSTKVYIDKTKGQWPRRNLIKALQAFEREFDRIKDQRQLVAADLGAGAGNETIFLIEKGWKVIAIDIDPYSIETINDRFQELQSLQGDGSKAKLGSLDARLVSMQKMVLEPFSLDLVNASLSLPFVPRSEMKEVWNNIIEALRVGGVFTGHFFGSEHGWRNRLRMSFYSEKEIYKEFLDDYSLRIESFSEMKSDAPTAAGGTVFFHTFTVIAQKTDDHYKRNTRGMNPY